ncbi:polyprenyl synthetase family protein [Putridiphycobacter roseus]|uniref:Polyprenyl synthetase family protein n=1 Tax=Putridiphycobacter roseus TaxID=2219161 RepID=A0A2W1MXS6_9FLAO|nr:polyprenyl synthetase family protein [Putridiphycobacter roseus]PZE16959.1 polyprenyl synthetase family protein [Putridiphycobacter roseus]
MIDLSRYQNIIGSEIAQINFPKAPQNLYAPLTYFLALGGKRMRPILALMGCELFDKDLNAAKHAALAVELFHNFSLIHDDIMDDAPLRRGKATVHSKWDQNIAILSGDVLMVKAYEHLATYDGQVLKSLLQLFNTTAKQVCEGQQWDMDYESATAVTIDQYIKMISYKTAVLLGCSLEMGAIIAGTNTTNRKALYEFGLNLGIAFQLQDDLLDVYADQNKFGKQVGGDILANKKTFLLLKAFEDADASTKTVLQNSLTNLKGSEKITAVKAIYAQLDIPAKTTEKMNEYYEIALQNLSEIKVPKNQKAPLFALSEFLMQREH